ncbi:DUF4355 domain-containing protein [Listeria monocytogenes]|uniref:capsid assembly scaffolding protein Gp46 family protein n=1 Tax=Listeria monocytogenes TaxID=1639 RepID=UPI00086953F9|nr:DUF4355 domain-containing protein [Listeria monocytogenes]EAE5023167.1 DUF4355 domain-containing protein [Listeria monocytogenes]EAG6738011.1 DUF4355 domain-containing protein [Listeria monocytogenes]EED2333584.1 DUF4355 domain-containing protein [Listeria monocytogenes]OEP00529.1 hypothetical protein AJZ92_04275 [Listeria monocytogenes]HAA9732578.1 scaffolding protein [Listeria monocytogenes]
MPEENLKENEITTEEESQSDDTFTQSQVDSQVSKAVDKALNKAKAKWEHEQNSAIEKAKNDAAEYAKLTEAQKQEADFKKKQEALAAQEAEFNSKRLLVEVKEDLQKEGLPISFAESLIGIGDNEKIKKAIDGLKKEWDSQIAGKLKESARQTTPSEAAAFKDKNGNPLSKAAMANAARIIK